MSWKPIVVFKYWASGCEELFNHIFHRKIISEPIRLSSLETNKFNEKISSSLPEEAAAAGAPPAGAAPAPDPTLVMRALTSTPSKALAKRPGQYGSTLTSAAFRMVEIFSAYTQIQDS